MYSEEYQRKLVTPQQAAATVPEGGSIIHGLTMAEPPALLHAVADRLRAGDLKHLQVHSLLPLEHAHASVLDPALASQVEAFTWFVGPGDREAVQSGHDHFIPSHLHQVPRLLTDGPAMDACLTMVSPMDASGYFSFGTANDFTSTAARRAKKLLVEVNENMPRVFGQALLHISEVDLLVENHQPILEMPSGPSLPEDQIIGKTIAELVPNHATLQLGIGSLPGAVADFLMGHKDLGLHTEVFGPAMVKLIKAGVITGKKKSLHRRKHVFTVAQGDKEMLEFMDNNPAMASYPVSYSNHPSLIAKNDKMISINSLIQVDLTGQCNAEYLAGVQVSGTGGQLDFVRGAYDSRGGKSILAFRSTAHGGTVSRVVPRLELGAAVTTPRMDTHFLVTEFGAANLKGKSTRQRAKAIIGLAHPEFREELERQAREMHLA
jgi:itaconate CoA-transferase